MAEADGPSIHIPTFCARANRFLAAWSDDADPDVSLREVNAVLLVAGGQDEDNPYKKTTAFQTWLLGYEFPSTIALLARNRIVFLAGGSRTKVLKPLCDAVKAQSGLVASLDVQVLHRTKDEEHNRGLWDQLASELKGHKIGHCPKDSFTGKFVTEWQAYQKSSGLTGSYELVDVSGSLAGIMAVKDHAEISSQTVGTKMAARLINYFAEEMVKIVENDQRITHEKLAEMVEGQLEKPTLWKGFDAGEGLKLDRTLCDWCYTPIIQSGGTYDLKSSAQSDESRLKPGVVYCSLGVRYKSYCCNVGRTYFVDPDPTQEANYLFLLSLQQHVFDQLRDGAVIKDVYNSALNFVRDARPDLEGSFLKNMGFIIGIEFRESAYVLGPKVTRHIREDMVVNVTLGFQDLSDPKDKKKTYSLAIIDTVRIGKNGATPLATEGAKKKDDVMFYFQKNEKAKSKQANGKSPGKAAAGGTRSANAVVKSRLRNEGKGGDDAASNRRKAHQNELAERKQSEGLEKFAEGGVDLKTAKDKAWKRFESYQREAQIPDAAAEQQIQVDERRNTIILPINGFAVPFHINTLKSVVKQEEAAGGYSTLRFMFVTPGQIAGKKEDTPFEDASANFVRGFTFRSTDSVRFATLHEKIGALKRNVVKRENERKEMADVVEQDNLVEDRQRRPITLRDTYLRPKFEGKVSTGDVEIHQNGIRWISSARSDHKVDILFNNIKHLFFQPCDQELIVLIHVTLKSPIIAGKKKVKELQFFRDASEAADETGNKKRRKQQMDEDELEAEQEERRQRARLNREFKAYAEKIAEASNRRFEVDIPFRELGFQGVPFRAACLLQPTTDCLVHLSDMPPLVITLGEIEIVHLERVQFGLKNFDMVFVFSDFTKPVVHVNTVPMAQLENVKDWLDSVDILYSEGPVNLNWPQIIKTVVDDPMDFFSEGGWSFLRGGGDDGGSDSDESSAASAFAPASSDLNPGSDSESDFEDDQSASDAGASEEEPSESGEEYGGESESEEEDKRKKKKR